MVPRCGGRPSAADQEALLLAAAFPLFRESISYAGYPAALCRVSDELAERWVGAVDEFRGAAANSGTLAAWLDTHLLIRRDCRPL